MNREKIKEMYFKYELVEEDVFKHQHYIILTRSAIEKIQAQEEIDFDFDVLKSEPNFASVKGWATKDNKTIRTTGSAKKGESFKDGNTNSWYVLEMAEKRCFARATLKLLGLYQIGVKSEDESEEFKRK
tara:strand:+ start:1114 stop:1500 length:387 start_codon:yes stop_codon:yes gene_type:complete